MKNVITTTVSNPPAHPYPEDETEYTRADRKEFFRSRLFNPKAAIPHPNYIMSLCGVDVVSTGNVSTIVAGPKAGKSSVVAAILASAINEETYLGIKCRNPEGRPIIHIDTEQSPSHHAKKIGTIKQRTGEDIPGHLVSFSMIGERLTSADIRTAIEVAIEGAGEEIDEVTPWAIILDGGADFLDNTNDIEESQNLVKDMMAIAVEFDTAIIVSIHLNPSPEGGVSKGRGHFGSELERKSETYLTIKREEDVRTLYTRVAREEEVPVGDGARFAWDVEAGMFNTLAEEQKSYSTMDVLGVLDDAGGSLTRPKLKAALKEKHGGDPKTWDKRLKVLKADGLITYTGNPTKAVLNKNGKDKLKSWLELETVIDLTGEVAGGKNAKTC